MQRFSKKREAILTCLQNTKSHPTAEWIYDRLKPTYPDLSLGTVYRNLLQMKKAGLICSIGTVDGQERYDADMVPHVHAVCMRCGKVEDLSAFSVPDQKIIELEQLTGFQLVSAKIQLSGLCKECRDQQPVR